MAKPKDRYRKIALKMHTDEKYMALSGPGPNGKSLFEYLLHGPHTIIIPGLSSIGAAALAERLKWKLGKEIDEPTGKQPTTFFEAFAELKSKRMVVSDWTSQVLWIPNAIKHNPPASPKVVTGWAQAWSEIPECKLKNKALVALHEYVEGLGKGFQEAFHKGFEKEIEKAFAYQEQEQEQDNTNPPPPFQGEGVGGDVDPVVHSHAMSYARCWISSNCQRYLKNSHIKPFERLIEREGKERAVELVLDAMKKPHVGNPFAYAEEKLEKQALAEDLGAPIQETSEEFARRNAAKVR